MHACTWQECIAAYLRVGHNEFLHCLFPLMERMPVSYSLYYTDPPNRFDSKPDAAQITPVIVESLGEAITAACSLILDGLIVWQIRGTSGFMMERSDIEHECGRRKSRILG
jgi:hypothetical protein